jgi:hypothetical protein
MDKKASILGRMVRYLSSPGNFFNKGEDMEELENSSQADPVAPEMLLPPRVEEAVENAQFLVTYAAEAGKGINENTVKVLIEARNAVSAKEWSPEIEIAFWSAYNQITNDVKPVTVDSVKALYPSHSGIFRLFGRSKARRSVNLYTIIAVVTLTILLFLQAYLVIGNTVSTDLDDLMQQDTDLRAAIKEESKRYAEIERLYITIEKDFKENQGGSDEGYSFYSSPSWYQNTLDITAKQESLEEELDDLQPTIERSASILNIWTRTFDPAIHVDDMNGPYQDEINAVKEQIRLEGDETTSNDLNKQLADLERQSRDQRTRELVQRTIKSAEFALTFFQFLQTYFLPLLYGLLGATVYILRSLSRDIKTVTYSKHSNTSFILRLALGSLAGLVVGWFIFALPGTTILSSISPLAIAFLVGYNIEILFSLMDKMRDSLSKSETDTEEPETSKSEPSPAEK